jgi:hypothetical protein
MLSGSPSLSGGGLVGAAGAAAAGYSSRMASSAGSTAAGYAKRISDFIKKK